MIGGAALLLLNVQGCMNSPSQLSANEAFALSASALSGSESYEFTGEVSMFDPSGTVRRKDAYEGEVTSHGNLKLQWKNSDTLSTSTSANSQQKTAYRPLQLLESIKGKSAVISYSENPVSSQPVQFEIKLEDATAKERVVQGLRDELALLGADKDLLRGDPVKADQILHEANMRLEATLSTLQVTTVCHWTADARSWFPSQLKEETVLSYTWDNKSYKEKRISETNFTNKAQGGTMSKSNIE